MKFIYPYIVTFIIITSLSSCGYQLRGSANGQEFENITVISSHSDSIVRTLQQSFKVVSNYDESKPALHPVIKIVRVSSKTRQLSVNSSGRADEYEIRKSLEYEFILPNMTRITDTLHATGSYDFNEAQMHGTKEKESITNKAIDRTLIRKLLIKLRSAINKMSKSQ